MSKLQNDQTSVNSTEVAEDDAPEHVPARGWLTLGMFAVFVVAFGTCASTYLFR